MVGVATDDLRWVVSERFSLVSSVDGGTCLVNEAWVRQLTYRQRTTEQMSLLLRV